MDYIVSLTYEKNIEIQNSDLRFFEFQQFFSYVSPLSSEVRASHL
jgi:hypothetical protein